MNHSTSIDPDISGKSFKSDQELDGTTSGRSDDIADIEQENSVPEHNEGSARNSDLPQFEPPPYEALSYVWWPPQCDRSFLCPTGIVPITINLEVALKWIPSVDQVRVVWADAICINQKDVTERGHQ